MRKRVPLVLVVGAVVVIGAAGVWALRPDTEAHTDSLCAQGALLAQQSQRPSPQLVERPKALRLASVGLTSARLPEVPIGAELGPNTLCVQEAQKIRVEVADEGAPPFVGKRFSAQMLANAQGGGTFDCEFADRVPEGFETGEPDPPLTVYCFRKPGWPIGVQWRDAKGNCDPDFWLADVPRAKPNRGHYPSDGAWFEYEGRALVAVPDILSSACTVAPSTIRAGKTTQVVLSLSLAQGRDVNQPRRPIIFELMIPSRVGDATIAADPPDDPRVRNFEQLTCSPKTPYSAHVGIPFEDLPTTIRFSMRVSPAARGSLRLGNVVRVWRILNEPVLPKAVVTCPQADSLRHGAFTQVERVHEVTIRVR